MVEFETLSCNSCGDSFKVHPSAAAAETGYCSPACETDGEGLA
jgi:hypothetical protein